MVLYPLNVTVRKELSKYHVEKQLPLRFIQKKIESFHAILYVFSVNR